MQEAAAQGAAIVLISSELPELLGHRRPDRRLLPRRGPGRVQQGRMQEDDIAHVAVTGADRPDRQTSMETS